MPRMCRAECGEFSIAETRVIVPLSEYHALVQVRDTAFLRGIMNQAHAYPDADGNRRVTRQQRGQYQPQTVVQRGGHEIFPVTVRL